MNPLAFLPYALAAYGGYKGYQANKQAGASGLERILGGITGAVGGYYGGKSVLGGGAQLGIPGFQTAASKFTPFAQVPGISQMLPASMRTTTPQMVGQVDPGVATETIEDLKRAADERSLLQKLLYKKDTPSEIDPMKLFAGVSGLSYLSGAFKQGPVDMYQPTYNVGYARFAEERPAYSYIDPATGEEKQYEEIYKPEADPRNRGDYVSGPYAMTKTRLKEGGLAEVRKFNEGGINYLPSKVSHDEYDANNYVRASGYVEDGSGNGDKDEDTMLAQLADGEFVTRADGVLGAGIIAGANPNSMKDMREKGAQYFYEQQKRFKRIFDLLEKANGQNSKAN